jgi:hypothetical protein
MTETPEHTTELTTEPVAVEPRTEDSLQRVRRRDRHPRIYRIAAAVVTLAATVFVIAVIFWSGFVLGAHAGGHHGHHGGGGMHNAAMMHQGHGGHGDWHHGQGS